MTESLDKYYQILELDENATKDDIKRAYRRLALRYHPDKNPGNEEWSARIFTALNEAYSKLIDVNHIGKKFKDIDEVKDYFKRNFYDLARRIISDDYNKDKVSQEECDYFFQYQLKEVSCVRRSTIEARRIITLIKKASSKGYDTTSILKDHSEFFEKFGFGDNPKYDGYKDLIAKYKRIIDEEPGNAFAHYALGYIYEKRDMIDEALFEYRLALNIDPDNIKSRRAIERLNKYRNKKESYG